MHLKQLEYFVAAAEFMNFSHAAERLFISQQALSEQISRLESEYGVKFFIRGRKMMLTRDGECMLKAARQILAQERSLRNELEILNSDVHGTLNVGMSYIRSRLMFPSCLTAFRAKYPYVTVKLFTGSSEKLKNDIITGVTDIVIGFDQFNYESINTFPLWNERLFLTVPQKYLIKLYGRDWEARLPQLNQGTDLSVFAYFPFVVLEKQYYIQKVALPLFNAISVEPDIVFEGNDLELVCSVSKAGLGLSFASEMFVSVARHLFAPDGEDTLYAFPLAGPVFLPLVIGYNKTQYFSQLSRTFVEVTRENYKKARLLNYGNE